MFEVSAAAIFLFLSAVSHTRDWINVGLKVAFLFMAVWGVIEAASALATK